MPRMEGESREEYVKRWDREHRKEINARARNNYDPTKAREKYLRRDREKLNEWRRAYRKTGKAKKYDRMYRRMLVDSYIKQLIKIKNPSQELIDIWRETLLVKRAAKKVQEALNDRGDGKAV